MKKILMLVMLAGSISVISGCGKDEAATTAALTTPASNSIVSRWRFNVDTYSGQSDIGGGEGGSTAKIGTIQLVIFEDGSSFISVNGAVVASTSGSDLYQENFEHSFYLPKSGVEQEHIVKINSYANSRVRYHINTAATPVPTFKAVMDVDGNFANQTDVALTLAAE